MRHATMRAIFAFAILCAICLPAHAQQPTPLPVTVTLNPQEYQAVVSGLGELPLKLSVDAFAVLTKAQQEAQAKTAAVPKPAVSASQPKAK